MNNKLAFLVLVTNYILSGHVTLSFTLKLQSFPLKLMLSRHASSPPSHLGEKLAPTSTSLFSRSLEIDDSTVLDNDGIEVDDDGEEWIEEEFELLTERDFYNTEWKIGTLMDDKPRSPKNIDTTWVRLTTTEGGENKAIWGDNSRGKWTVDVSSQYFSISKESFGGWFGKKIWAGTIEDFYYLGGTVRGWNPISPASVLGQWQAVRLGVMDGERVTEKERGIAPWFATESEGDGTNENSDA